MKEVRLTMTKEIKEAAEMMDRVADPKHVCVNIRVDSCWTGHKSGSGLSAQTPPILHYNWL
jgi:hypothetical protein